MKLKTTAICDRSTTHKQTTRDTQRDLTQRKPELDWNSPVEPTYLKSDPPELLAIPLPYPLPPNFIPKGPQGVTLFLSNNQSHRMTIKSYSYIRKSFILTGSNFQQVKSTGSSNPPPQDLSEPNSMSTQYCTHVGLHLLLTPWYYRNKRLSA